VSDGPAAAVRRERVALAGRETDIRIGPGLLGEVWAALRSGFPRAARCGLAVDERVRALWPLPPPPADLEIVEQSLPPGEAAKDRAVLARLQDGWIDLRRDEPVLVMGGGAALDVGGLAAATVRRGLPWIALPTSVVAMADAAVGGKTAVNHPRGKNLIGTFHPPVLVLADVATLATLDDRDRVAGLAEVYKCGRIADAALLAQLRRGAPRDDAAWLEAIHRSVAVKARLVEQDERDQGPRRLLNYGHTVGHALETLLGNEVMRHGEAVAIGMQVAARVAMARGLLTEQDAERQRSDLEGLGLATRLPEPLPREEILAQIAGDKKRATGALHTMVLPTGGLGAQVIEDVTDDQILVALGPV